MIAAEEAGVRASEAGLGVLVGTVSAGTREPVTTEIAAVKLVAVRLVAVRLAAGGIVTVEAVVAELVVGEFVAIALVVTGLVAAGSAAGGLIAAKVAAVGLAAVGFAGVGLAGVGLAGVGLAGVGVVATKVIATGLVATGRAATGVIAAGAVAAKLFATGLATRPSAAELVATSCAAARLPAAEAVPARFVAKGRVADEFLATVATGCGVALVGTVASPPPDDDAPDWEPVRNGSRTIGGRPGVCGDLPGRTVWSRVAGLEGLVSATPGLIAGSFVATVTAVVPTGNDDERPPSAIGPTVADCGGWVPGSADTVARWPAGLTASSMTAASGSGGMANVVVASGVEGTGAV